MRLQMILFLSGIISSALLHSGTQQVSAVSSKHRIARCCSLSRLVDHNRWSQLSTQSFQGKINSKPWRIFGIRGGSDDENSSFDDDDEEEEFEDLSSDKEEDVSTQNDNNDDVSSKIESSTKEESDAEEGSKEEKENTDKDVDLIPNKSSSGPIKLIVKTALHSPLIDQTWESTCSRTRTIASIKQNLARQMRGRPPASLQRLLYHGVQELNDDVTLESILDDNEDEEDDEDEEEDGMVKLKLTLDMPPPIDAKFATDYEEMLKKLSRNELIEAYAANVAATTYTAECLFSSDNIEHNSNEDQQEEKINNDEKDLSLNTPSATLTMRKHAILIKEQMLSTLSEEIRKSVEEDYRTEEEEQEEEALLKRNVSKKLQGGAAMNVKLILQKNLNLDWGDTIRNFVLFLFFGFVGARDPLSKLIMITAAPMCFILQARPVKLLLKQMFYAIGTPPPILLSLLPAPQQAIMGLNYDAVMKDLYGISSSTGEIQEEEREDEDVIYYQEDDDDQIQSEDDEEEDYD